MRIALIRLISLFAVPRYLSAERAQSFRPPIL